MHSSPLGRIRLFLRGVNGKKKLGIEIDSKGRRMGKDMPTRAGTVLP